MTTELVPYILNFKLLESRKIDEKMELSARSIH
jgi:hypothetical protein